MSDQITRYSKDAQQYLALANETLSYVADEAGPRQRQIDELAYAIKDLVEALPEGEVQEGIEASADAWLTQAYPDLALVAGTDSEIVQMLANRLVLKAAIEGLQIDQWSMEAALERRFQD